MNQIEMNKIAISFINQESYKVAKKLDKILSEDLKVKSEELPGMTIHHIHNMAIFNLLVMLNPIFTAQKKVTKEAVGEYCLFSESLKPKFLEIVEALKDFVPEEKPLQLNDESDD